MAAKQSNNFYLPEIKNISFFKDFIVKKQKGFIANCSKIDSKKFSAPSAPFSYKNHRRKITIILWRLRRKILGFYIVETCLRTVWTAFHPFSKCVQVRSKSTSDLDASWSASDQPGRISLQLRLDLATWTHFDLDALFFGDLTWTRVQGVQVATWTQNITVSEISFH